MNKLIASFATAMIVATLNPLSAPAKTLGELANDLESNLASAAATSAWTQCGGSSSPESMDSLQLLKTLACYGNSNSMAADDADDILTGLSTKIADTHPDQATPESMMNQSAYQAQIFLTEMKITAHQGKWFKASQNGKLATFFQKQCDETSEQFFVMHPCVSDTSLHEEERLYWSMLPPNMQKVLLTHGGTMDSNRDARPQEWKNSDLSTDLWVYKTGNAVVTTYVFTNGKLTDTLKP